MHASSNVLALTILGALLPQMPMAQPLQAPSIGTPATAYSPRLQEATPSASAPTQSKTSEVTASFRTAPECDALSTNTGKAHYYGEGVLESIVDAVPAAEGVTNPFDQSASKGYIAHFTSRDFNAERTYIRATNARFKNSVVALETRHPYSFCYALQGTRHTAIDQPETIRRLEE